MAATVRADAGNPPARTRKDDVIQMRASAETKAMLSRAPGCVGRSCPSSCSKAPAGRQRRRRRSG